MTSSFATHSKGRVAKNPNAIDAVERSEMK
jgi:hypothetical protein